MRKSERSLSKLINQIMIFIFYFVVRKKRNVKRKRNRKRRIRKTRKMKKRMRQRKRRKRRSTMSFKEVCNKRRFTLLVIK